MIGRRALAGHVVNEGVEMIAKGHALMVDKMNAVNLGLGGGMPVPGL